MIRFGTAGSPDDFYDKGHKSSLEMPKYLADLGLNAFEYQCGRGVRISAETAGKLGEEARKHGIALSVHAPYFINIATDDSQKRENSRNYIMDTLRAARAMSATRIVVHMGGAGKSRSAAMQNSREFVPFLMGEVANQKFDDIAICFETMGKINQLGTLEETLEICALDERLLPTIDFGHLNARTHGSLKTAADYEVIFVAIESKLGKERANNFHVHFSKIAYTKGGESKHLTFEDTEYGPEFGPLAEVIMKRKAMPTIICESRGTQGVDALFMKGCVK